MTRIETADYPTELSLFRLRASWGGWPDGIGEIRSLSGPPHESVILNGPLSGRRLTELAGRFPDALGGQDYRSILQEYLKA